jgi:hypothetical protein
MEIRKREITGAAALAIVYLLVFNTKDTHDTVDEELRCH